MGPMGVGAGDGPVDPVRLSIENSHVDVEGSKKKNKKKIKTSGAPLRKSQFLHKSLQILRVDPWVNWF